VVVLVVVAVVVVMKTTKIHEDDYNNCTESLRRTFASRFVEIAITACFLLEFYFNTLQCFFLSMFLICSQNLTG
jgi:hypothetical protein